MTRAAKERTNNVRRPVLRLVTPAMSEATIGDVAKARASTVRRGARLALDAMAAVSRAHEAEPSDETRDLALLLEAVAVACLQRGGDTARAALVKAAAIYLDEGPGQRLVAHDHRVTSSRGRADAARAVLRAADLAIRYPLRGEVAAGVLTIEERAASAARTVLRPARAFGDRPDALEVLSARILASERAKRNVTARTLATWALEAEGVERAAASNFLRAASAPKRRRT